jgi:hypothetical protein
MQEKNGVSPGQAVEKLSFYQVISIIEKITDTGNTTYTYNANKLASASGEKIFNFSYDNDGNTTSENNKQYIYNYNQRLTRVTVSRPI